jgi:hypothetical protein
MRAERAAWALLLLSACSETKPPEETEAPVMHSSSGDCELGRFDEETGLEFVSIEDSMIPMVGSSQSALYAEFALRAKDPGIPRIEITLVATELDSENHVEIEKGNEFSCEKDDWCYYSPLYVPTSNLVDDVWGLRYLEVKATAKLSDRSGTFCKTSLEGKLHRLGYE